MVEDDDYFGIRYSGYILIPENNVYTFTSTSDDGSFIFIDGKKIVDNDFQHGAFSLSGEVGLEAGYHPIEIWFFEKWGGEYLEIAFASDKTGLRRLTGNMLFHK